MASRDYELKEIKKANCYEDGFKIYINKKGEEEKVIIPKRNHNWKEIIIKEPTCTEKGIKSYICINEENDEYEKCNASENEIEISELGHLCKSINIARNKSALRRGTIINCIRDGCNYSYTLYFQNKIDGIEIGEGPASAPLDVDYFDDLLFYFHFGADLSNAKIEIIEGKERGLLLT